MPPPSLPVTSSDSDSGCGGGCVGGIIGGCFVPLLLLILWLSGVFAKYGWPSPFAKAGSIGNTTVSTTSAAATARAEVEVELKK